MLCDQTQFLYNHVQFLIIIESRNFILDLHSYSLARDNKKKEVKSELCGGRGAVRERFGWEEAPSQGSSERNLGRRGLGVAPGPAAVAGKSCWVNSQLGECPGC